MQEVFLQKISFLSFIFSSCFSKFQVLEYLLYFHSEEVPTFLAKVGALYFKPFAVFFIVSLVGFHHFILRYFRAYFSLSGLILNVFPSFLYINGKLFSFKKKNHTLLLILEFHFFLDT